MYTTGRTSLDSSNAFDVPGASRKKDAEYGEFRIRKVSACADRASNPILRASDMIHSIKCALRRILSW